MRDQPTSNREAELTAIPPLAPATCSAAVLAREMLHYAEYMVKHHRDYAKNSDPDCGSRDYHEGAMYAMEMVKSKAERLCAEMAKEMRDHSKRVEDRLATQIATMSCCLEEIKKHKDA